MTTTTEFNEADLPELPEFYGAAGDDAWTPAEKQVIRAYALAAAAASRKKLMEQEPVGVTDMAGGIHWKRGAPIQATLYTAPMPQANESEAVKALRRVVSNYETNCSVRDAWAWHEDSYKVARAVLAGKPGAKDEQATGKQDLQVEQPEQAQAMDERNEFERKFPMPPHCVRCGDGYSATEYHAWLAHSYKDKWEGWQARAALAQAQASGKAAPSDEDIIHIAVRTVPAFKNRDALTFARALLERYGNHE